MMRDQNTSTMYDVSRHLHQVLGCDLGELGWKNILNHVHFAFICHPHRILHRHFDLQLSERHWHVDAGDCGGHVAVPRMMPTRMWLLTLQFKTLKACQR